MKTNKLSNHIILSSIVSSMLFSPLMALPSGGKFTHGTSGTITTNGNNMQVSGNGLNSVIQWGGGFSIGKGQSVNFGNNNFKGQQNYLNIAHGANKSMIEGVLNAGGNNVFLINPNGVIITKTGTINANRFVASTSSMSNESMQDFADGKLAYNTFSPVFKPNGGNVVNMGNINANNVTLQGNKIVLDLDLSDKNNPNQIKAKDIILEGSEVYVNVASINGVELEKLEIKGNNVKGAMYLDAVGYYHNPRSFLAFGKHEKTSNSFKVHDYVGIGSDVDWWHFAKGWNDDKEGFRETADEYRLTSDIDFKASSGQNYANYCIEGLGCTNMIVGYKDAVYNDDWELVKDNGFSNKTFDGQGFTLSNISINTTDMPSITYAGIFGSANNSVFKNIKVDYNQNSIISHAMQTGGFIGYASSSSKFENIELKNISKISAQMDNNLYVGGFVGNVNGATFDQILLGNIGEISGLSTSFRSHIGGFVGSVNNGKFENISIFDIKKILNDKTAMETYTGGFAGEISFEGGQFNNIDIRGIEEIRGGFVTGGFSGNIYKSEVSNINLDIGDINSVFNSSSNTYAGGFAGSIDSGKSEFGNISVAVRNIKSINEDSQSVFYDDSENIGNAYAGGFVGFANGGIFDNISIKANKIEAINDNNLETGRAVAGGFAGKIEGYRSDKLTISNITIRDIDTILGRLEQDKNSIVNVGGFAGWIQKEGQGDLSNISLYNIKNIQAYGKGDFANAGGFIGRVDGRGLGRDIKLNLKNIYLFFEKNSQIYSSASEGKAISGKFISAYDDKTSKLFFDDIHVYHHESDFSDVDSDKNYWKDTQVNIHTYNDENKEEKYKEFLNQDNSIARPIIELPSKPEFVESEKINYPDVESIKNEEAILGEDDLFEVTIKEEILGDLIEQHYKVYIDTLLQMLAEKDYKLMTLEEKIEFISKYFLKDTVNNKEEALKIIQSLEFIAAYQDNGLNQASEGKFESGIRDFYIKNIKANMDKVLENKDRISFALKNDLKDVVLNSNSLIAELEEIKKQLQALADQYNEYVRNNTQIDTNVLSELLLSINSLSKQQDAILSQLGLSDIKSKIEYKIDNGSFLLVGDYAQTAYKPILEAVNINPGNSSKPDLPWIDLFPTLPDRVDQVDYVTFGGVPFGLMGNDFIRKEPEINIIGETEGDGYKKTCVTSSNSKVMNACIN